MSNKVKHWHLESRKPKKNKRIVPMHADDSRVIPLRVDSNRITPLRAGDDFNDWDENGT